MIVGNDGETWSEPIQVNHVDHPRDNHYKELYPTVDVAPSGRVDVAWYDWRNDPPYSADASEGGLQDIYYRYSTDGGRHGRRARRSTTVPSTAASGSSVSRTSMGR